MTWVIIEDDTDIRNIVNFMCTAWGHDTLLFPDGEKAYTWVEAVDAGTVTDSLPEMALIDIRMPGYTGDVVAGRIRQSAALKDIAIVLMTAYSLSEAEYKRIMQASGADLLIRKPLPDMHKLQATLYRVLDEKKAGRL